MNKAYRLVWDELRGMLVVVAENSRARGKKDGKSGGRKVAASVFALALAGAVTALPAGDAWAAVCAQNAGTGYDNGQPGSIVCGTDATAGNVRTVVIGSSQVSDFPNKKTQATGMEGIAIGFDAQSLGGQSIVLGSQAKADGPQSIAIGANVRAQGASSVAIGGDDVGKQGQSGQLGDAWVAVNSLKEDLVEQGLTVPGMVQRVTNGDWYADTTRSRGDGSVAIGAKATSTGPLSSAIGMGAESLGKASTALGTTALAVGEFSSALGAAATAAGTRSSSYGMGTAAVGTDAVALGTGAYVGADDVVKKINDLALAYQKELSAYDKLEKDGATSAQLQDRYANYVVPAKNALENEISNYATTYGRGVAVGAKSQALVADGVALGSGSVADRRTANGGQGAGYDVRTGAAYVKGDNDKNKWDAEGSVWTSTLAAVSVGSAGDGKTELRKDGDDYYLFTTDANGISTKGDQVYVRLVDGFDSNNDPIYRYDAYKEENYLAGATPYSSSGEDLSAKIVRTRQITNVAAGSADTDAVNVAQLKLVRENSWQVGGNLVQDNAGNITGSDGNKYKYDGDGPITIKQGDVVNFVDGDGTTAVTSDKTIVGYDSNGDPITINSPSVTYNVNKTPVKPNSATGTAYGWCADENCATKLTWDGEKFLDPTDPTQPYSGPVYTIGVNGQPGTLVDATAPTKQYVTAGDVANTINNTYWRVKGAGNQATGSTAYNTEVGVHAGDLVTFEAGDGVTLKAVKNKAWSATTPGETTYTFAVNKNTTVPDVVTTPNNPNPGDKPGQITGGTTNQYWDSSQVQTAVNSAHWNIGYGNTPNTAPTSYPGKVSPGDNVGLVGGEGVTISQLGTSNVYQFSVDQNYTGSDGGHKYQGDDGHLGTDHIVTPPANGLIGIKGGYTVDTTDPNKGLTTGNIGVVKGNGDDLYVKLAEDIDLGSDGSVKTGDTLVDNGGVTIGDTTSGPSTQITNGNITFKNDQGKTDGGTIDGLTSHFTEDVTTVDSNPHDSVDADKYKQGATYEDVVKAGWNLQSQNHDATAPKPVDYVTYDNTVNFKSANDYLDISSSSDGDTSTITFKVQNIDDAGLGNTKPLKFQGDSGNALTPTHGDTVNVVGGADPNKLTKGNIGVVTDPSTNTMNVQLAENVDLGGDGSMSFGDTIIKNDGKGNVYIGGTYDPTTNTYAPTKITNVKAGEDPTDAVNMSQLNDLIGDDTNTNPQYGLYVGGNEDTGGRHKLQTGQTFSLQGGEGQELSALTAGKKLADGVGALPDDAYSPRNLTTRRYQDAAGNTIVMMMSENPSFRNNVTGGRVDISSKEGTISAGRGGSTGNAPPVVVGTQTPPSSSYVGNGGPNPATGNYVTGLENKKWSNGNYVSGRAATEDQLQAVAESMDLSFSGDRNIWVGRSGNHVSIRLNPNVHVDSVTVNNGVYVVDGPSMTKQGINAAGTTITNVAPGIEETDAVNVGQLRRLEHKVNKMGDRADAGIAGAMAAAAVPQVTVPGANLLGAGAGYFHDQSAVAVGYSAMSDNGKWILKANASVSTEEAAASAGVGYQW